MPKVCVVIKDASRIDEVAAALCVIGMDVRATRPLLGIIAGLAPDGVVETLRLHPDVASVVTDESRWTRHEFR